MTQNSQAAVTGAILIGLRESRGWSRSQLEHKIRTLDPELVGVSTSTIKNLELGKRTDGSEIKRPYARTIAKFVRPFGRDDGLRILEAFGYEGMIDEVFPAELDETLNTGASDLGITSEQAIIINRLIDEMIKLARSGNRDGQVIDIRRIPRYVNLLPIRPLAPVLSLHKKKVV